MDASEPNPPKPDFVEQLLRLTQGMLQAAQAEDWDGVVALTQQRDELLQTEAAKSPPAPGTEPVWREVERLNREVLGLTESQLRHLGDSVQSARNKQRLQQSYGG